MKEENGKSFIILRVGQSTGERKEWLSYVHVVVLVNEEKGRKAIVLCVDYTGCLHIGSIYVYRALYTHLAPQA